MQLTQEQVLNLSGNELNKAVALAQGWGIGVNHAWWIDIKTGRYVCTT